MIYSIYVIAQNLVPLNADDIGIPRVQGNGGTLDVIIGLVYTIIAALALFFIVRGALLFIQANGDPGQINEARNTVIFSVIGLVLSTLVFTIINFVLRSV